MAGEAPQKPSSPVLERHLQTLLLSIIAGLIAWGGMTINGTAQATVRLDERVVQMTKTVEEARLEVRDLGKLQAEIAAQGADQRQQLWGEIARLQARIGVLEAQQSIDQQRRGK